MSDARLVEKLASGHFYDYEQQVKTLFFKYKMRKREKEMKELITRAMDDLNSHQQKDLVVDILEIYFVEHVKKINDNKAVDDYFVNLCKFTLTNGEKVRAFGIFERILGHIGTFSPQIALDFADALYQNQEYSRAYKYFFRARDEVKVVQCMREVIKMAYESEKDMFVVRAILDMMLRSPDQKKAQYIRDQFMEVESPLIDMLDLFRMCIEAKDMNLIVKMANEDYAPILKKDNEIYKKIDAVCENVFGQGIAPVNPMQAMMQNFMGGGKKK